ncbi:adenylate/guanylate cyclase domain-containing protein [Oscillatoria sp. FACHB-1406]|uniref:adenylate/guanylate cyclase domain-containing protein n=1 Tax=Oscillatoria sp. FACHB-1406 TaxID=2692846 RepID=UPI001681C91F|nr:adenylate/guanylate cyclase domain-containing protein [Oscillatoria sp. FACHB-1406]MBD2576835.1 response regulator [Oscillatoria sp. FACHB-1406]
MKKRAILCVDDERTVLLSLKAELREAFGRDYAIEIAESGSEALELFEDLRAEGYDIPVIISDYIMPHLKGDELLKRIHQQYPEALKIMLTGQADATAVGNAVNEAKLYRYISKPWQAEDLNLTVAEALNSYLQKQQIGEQTLKLQQVNQALEAANQKQLQLISQLQENENRLQQFLDGIPVGVVIINNNGILSYLNRKAKYLLGRDFMPGIELEKIDNMYQLYRVNTEELYSPEDLPLNRALNGETTRLDDLEIRHSNISIPLESWGTPIYDANGKIAYAIAAFADISDRLAAEQERQQFISDLFKVNVDLEAALDAQVQLTEATARFVPYQFLQLLDKESIVDIELGETVEQEMSILFSDIRSFTTLSEQMSMEENVTFINDYLSHMEPAIIENRGFIDKYIGDGIMALFHGSADDALQAGITMLQRLDEFNAIREQQERRKIAIGIGINTGKLMLGTVGGQSRMDSTAIGDAVNLASRLEGLTKEYGLPLLISEQTWLKLANPERYAIRPIDKTQVKGKLELVTVYEVFEMDDAALKEGKFATRWLFEEARQLYQQQVFEEAAIRFSDCLNQNPRDRAARILLNRCQNQQSFVRQSLLP